MAFLARRPNLSNEFLLLYNISNNNINNTDSKLFRKIKFVSTFWSKKVKNIKKNVSFLFHSNHQLYPLLSVFVSIYLSVFDYISLSLILSLSVFNSISFCLWFYLFLSLILSLSLSLILTLSLSLILSLSLSLILSLSVFHSDSFLQIFLFLFLSI